MCVQLHLLFVPGPMDLVDLFETIHVLLFCMRMRTFFYILQNNFNPFQILKLRHFKIVHYITPLRTGKP